MADSEQNRTEYEPTQAARRLAEIRTDPEHRLKPVREICRLADISPDTYYRLMDDLEGYVAWEKAEAKAKLGRFVAPILTAYVREALRGSKQHGDTILEITGDYTPKSRMELTGKDGAPLGGILPKDEVESQLKALGILPEKDEQTPEAPH